MQLAMSFNVVRRSTYLILSSFDLNGCGSAKSLAKCNTRSTSGAIAAPRCVVVWDDRAHVDQQLARGRDPGDVVARLHEVELSRATRPDEVNCRKHKPAFLLAAPLRDVSMVYNEDTLSQPPGREFSYQLHHVRGRSVNDDPRHAARIDGGGDCLDVCRAQPSTVIDSEFHSGE